MRSILRLLDRLCLLGGLAGLGTVFVAPAAARAHPVLPPCVFGPCVVTASVGGSIHGWLDPPLPETLYFAPDVRIGLAIDWFDSHVLIGPEGSLLAAGPEGWGAGLDLGVTWIPNLDRSGLHFHARALAGYLYYNGTTPDGFPFDAHGARFALEPGILWFDTAPNYDRRRDPHVAFGWGATAQLSALALRATRECDAPPGCDAESNDDAVTFGVGLRLQGMLIF
jgi:hypothetical protein